jgi:hypothetical protein
LFAVEVAPEESAMDPPVMVRPFVEERPVEAIPPANVLVALFPTIVVVAVLPVTM